MTAEHETIRFHIEGFDPTHPAAQPWLLHAEDLANPCADTLDLTERQRFDFVLASPTMPTSSRCRLPPASCIDGPGHAPALAPTDSLLSHHANPRPPSHRPAFVPSSLGHPPRLGPPAVIGR